MVFLINRDIPIQGSQYLRRVIVSVTENGLNALEGGSLVLRLFHKVRQMILQTVHHEIHHIYVHPKANIVQGKLVSSNTNIAKTYSRSEDPVIRANLCQNIQFSYTLTYNVVYTSYVYNACVAKN